MKLKKSNGWILNLNWDDLECVYRLGYDRLLCSPTERNVEVLADCRLSMHQQCVLAAKRANHTLGCIRHNISKQVKDEIAPLFPVLMWSHLEHSVQF